jgi:hypothetical protein
MPQHSADAQFEILDMQEEVYDDPDTGPRLARVVVRKSYRGEIDGHGEAHVLTAQGDQGGGYVASERVVGRLAGREGTFVIQHTGRADGPALSASGEIVPGSGTGALAGIRGTASESQRGVLTLSYELP